MQTNNEKINEYYLLDESNLSACDIILTTTTHKISKVIKKVTKGEYSHAMLYVGQFSCIDSTKKGVQSHNIQRLLFPSKNFCKVLRFKDALTDCQINSIINYVRQKVGTAYSVSEAIHAALKNRDEISELNRQFCSRLVAQAYNSAGLRIVNDPDYSSPEDINNSEGLKIVPNILRQASPEEIIYAREENTSLEKQAKAFNYIFENTRKLTGLDIQTMEQLIGLLIKFPKFDKEISCILEQSGYLNLWENDMKRNPWSYDLLVFEEYYPDIRERKKIAQTKASSEIELKKRFQISLETLMRAMEFNPLDSILIQIKLYEKLINLSEIRMEIWRQTME